MDRGKGLMCAIIVWVVIMAAGGIWAKGRYNELVDLEEQVNSAWSQVENQYQRRADLIPNLVRTVRGYAEHERTTLEAVTRARAEAVSAAVVGNLDEFSMQRFQAAQTQLDDAVSRLIISLEAYPTLRASQGFRELQVQLEGTENRIAVERRRFNEAARGFNAQVRGFPTNALAWLFGFEQKPYFSASAGAAGAPTVEFSGGAQ